MTHVNFHIGAPRIAADLIKDIARLKAIRTASHLKILGLNEFKTHLRSIVNASESGLDLLGVRNPNSEGFWTELENTQVVAASEHAMLGHPDKTFSDSQILPRSEQRVERLSSLLGTMGLDLHLTIANQQEYLARLPAETVMKINTFSRVPSWYELASRIQDVCPDRRLIVWDFTEPEKVGLPFVLALLDLEDSSVDHLKEPIRESLEHSRIMSRVFRNNVGDENLNTLLNEQFQQDLDAIDAMDNTVLVRSDIVPKEYVL